MIIVIEYFFDKFYFNPLGIYASDDIYKQNFKEMEHYIHYIPYTTNDTYKTFLQITLDSEANVMNLKFKNKIKPSKKWEIEEPTLFSGCLGNVQYSNKSKKRAFYKLPEKEVSLWSFGTRLFIKNWTEGTNSKNTNYALLHKDIEKELKMTVNEKEYTIYRGLGWKKFGSGLSLFLKNIIDGNLYGIGDKMIINIPNLSSWSEDVDIANGFAKSGGDYGDFDEKSLDFSEYFGILIKMTTDSKNVLCKLFDDEKELIILPNIYTVEIVSLYHNNKEVSSMKDWF